MNCTYGKIYEDLRSTTLFHGCRKGKVGIVREEAVVNLVFKTQSTRGKQLIFCPYLHPLLLPGMRQPLHDLGAYLQPEKGAVPASSTEMAMKPFAHFLLAIWVL